MKCLNKMQLLYVLDTIECCENCICGDTIELLNKYNWGDEKIE